MWETWVQSLGWEDPLEEGMATHSSIFAWRISWTEEPGGLQSLGRRVRCSCRIWCNFHFHFSTSTRGGLWTERGNAAAAAKSLWSCPTLCDPMDCSLPGSSIHGIFQARVLEQGAIVSSGERQWELIIQFLFAALHCDLWGFFSVAEIVFKHSIHLLSLNLMVPMKLSYKMTVSCSGRK